MNTAAHIARLKRDLSRDEERGIRLALHMATSVRYQALTLVRLAGALYGISPLLAAPVRWMTIALSGCDIAAAADVGGGLQLFHPMGVVVGPRCVVGENCTLMQGVTLGHGRGGSPILEDEVVVGPGAAIVGEYRIGAGAQIGANSVVTCDIPPSEIWVGVPARFLRRIE